MGLYHLCSENKGAAQLLRSYCAVYLRLCFPYAKGRFSHEAAHLILCAIFAIVYANEQIGLSLTWLEFPKKDFLLIRLKCLFVIG